MTFYFTIAAANGTLLRVAFLACLVVLTGSLMTEEAEF